MNRLFAIFSVTAVLSAALVAAAATGVFSGDGATNAARPKALPSRSGPLGGSEESADSIRQRALDAQKAARDSGLIPREDGQTPLEEAPPFLQGPDLANEPTPAIIADSVEDAELEDGDLEDGVGRVSPDTAFAEDLGEEAPKNIPPGRVKEITKKRAKDDPYKVVGPKVATDPFTGTTIINTSPYKD